MLLSSFLTTAYGLLAATRHVAPVFRTPVVPVSVSRVQSMFQCFHDWRAKAWEYNWT